MKYTVKHECGHTEELELFGKNEKRERRLEWEKGRPCWECRKEAKNEAAAQKAEADDWPEIEGSEKQVAWANTVRSEMIVKAEKLRKDNLSKARRLGQDGDEEKVNELMDNVIGKMLAKKSAGWWIDNRDRPINRVLAELQ